MPAEGGQNHVANLLVIAGPTASGKSALAMEIASRYSVEIVSADSMQIYRGMDIGTAKPTREERSRVRHHLIDIKDPDEPWSVEEFKTKAAAAIDEISGRGALACVVGGTGLYVRALLRGYPLTDAPPDWIFRRQLQDLARSRGNQAVHAMLREKDPASWEELHPNDLKRVVRALEYFRATGRPISARRSAKPGSPYRSLRIGLGWDRHESHARTDNRVEAQFSQGFVQEVEQLLWLGYREELPSMQGLGYKEICMCLRGLLTLDETKALIKRNTRRFAKRQLTWFSREEGINWVEAGKDTAWAETARRALGLVAEFLLQEQAAPDRPSGESWREVE
jgi:tRNA dimethylallyltransferase